MVHRRADVHGPVVVDRRAPRGAVGHVPQGLNFEVAFEDLDNLSGSRGRWGVDAELDHGGLAENGGGPRV